MHKNIYILLFLGVLLTHCKSSPVLKDTVLSLKEVKDVGELVTAEYYGEVLSGHSQLIQKGVDTLFFNGLKIIRNELDANKKEVSREYDAKIKALQAKIEKLENSNSLFGNSSKIKRLQKRIDKYETEKQRKLSNVSGKIRSENFKASLNLLKDITRENKSKILKAIETQTNDSLIYETYKQKIYKYIQKDKKELVYIGRGSVKAGYDLRNIDSTKIFFSENRDTMYLLDFDPFITDLDINPYFYFQADSTQDSIQIYGFQIIYNKKQQRFTLDEVSKVKSDCKLKLRQEALQRNIYKHAHQNAEDALSTFFGLMKTDKDKHVEKVIISHSKYFYYQNNYLYDLKIDSTEFSEIEAIISEDLDSLDEISFPHQTLNYQREHLDKFMGELYDKTKHAANYFKWDSLHTAYINQRQIRN